jgi:hypothetical protein
MMKALRAGLVRPCTGVRRVLVVRATCRMRAADASTDASTPAAGSARQVRWRMPKLEVSIEDTRTGEVETRVIENWSQSYRVGVVIGSAEDCPVRLVAPGVSAHHVRWYAGGYHRFIEVLDEDAVVCVSEGGGEHRGGTSLRIDFRSFMVGPYRLQF